MNIWPGLLSIDDYNDQVRFTHVNSKQINISTGHVKTHQSVTLVATLVVDINVITTNIRML